MQASFLYVWEFPCQQFIESYLFVDNETSKKMKEIPSVKLNDCSRLFFNTRKKMRLGLLEQVREC